MSGTGWNSADLLRRFNVLAGRPDADGMTPAKKFAYLADAQDSVLTKIASIVPNVLYGAPAALTSSDGGYTWTFGTDGDGYELFPIGKAHIYPDLQSIPTAPLRPGIDYLDEGTRIRMPNQVPWDGTLYWYGITPPGLLSATVAPVLQPPSARILIVIEAVMQFAESAGRDPNLADQMRVRWARDWGPSMTMIRTHLRGTSPSVSPTTAVGGLQWPFYGVSTTATSF